MDSPVRATRPTASAVQLHFIESAAIGAHARKRFLRSSLRSRTRFGSCSWITPHYSSAWDVRPGRRASATSTRWSGSSVFGRSALRTAAFESIRICLAHPRGVAAVPQAPRPPER